MVSATRCFCPLRGPCVTSMVKQRKDVFPFRAHNRHNRRTCFKMGSGQEKSLQRKVAGGLATPKPPTSATAHGLGLFLKDDSCSSQPREKAVAALKRRPGTVVWCLVGSAHKVIHGLHLFALCLFGAKMRHLFENVMGVQCMGLWASKEEVGFLKEDFRSAVWEPLSFSIERTASEFGRAVLTVDGKCGWHLATAEWALAGLFCYKTFTRALMHSVLPKAIY